MRTRHSFAIGFFVASVLTLPARPLTGANLWTIPGTVNVAGLNGTRFVSDLAVTNPTSATAQVTISLVPAVGTAPGHLNLPPGSTVLYRNLLERLWGVQGAGATRVSSEAPLLIRARTYNAAASGTYGVALPVFEDERLLAPGQTADSLWISQSADGASGFRTNVAVVFPDEGGGSATVTVYDESGIEAGSQDFSLGAPGFQQFAVGGFAGAVPVARARVQVTRGRAAGYSVVVDNVTGDSSLFSFEEPPSGHQDVVANGVARANGRNSTFFRTDGRFFNPTDEDAVVKVSFHASGPSNPAPLARTFTVGAGRILDVVDVLASLLDLPVGSAGALRFETDAPVGILCRTSNVDPAGVRPGTFGAQQRPTPLLSFLMSGDAGAVVTGIRQNEAFRTNLGFAAGADGAGYVLTLKTATGATVATATASLGTFGWTQPNMQELFPNETIPDDASLQVNLTSGSVDVFDSSIDNASGDPVVTPVMPLPAGIPATGTIGTAGGSIRSQDGRVTLKIPAGAFASPVTVALTPEATGEMDAFGSAYALTPSPLPLAKPALLEFREGDGPVPALGLAAVSLAVKTASGTFVATGGSIDPAAGKLTVPISSTDPSVVAGKAEARAGPAGPTQVVPLSSVFVRPDDASILTDGSVRIALALRNPPSAGGGPGGYVARLSDADLAVLSVRWTQPKIGRLDRTNDTSTTFTAPHRIRGPAVRADFRVSLRAVSVLRFDLPVSVVVVRRNWRIESEVGILKPCEPFGTHEVDWSWKEQGTFSIDASGRITKDSAATAQAKGPRWGLCPSPFYGWTTITPFGEFSADVTFEHVNGSPLSEFDFGRGEIVVLGYSDFKGGGATLTGTGVGPLTVGALDYGLGFSFSARPGQEGEWFDAPLVPGITTHRHRFLSVDTP